MKEITSIIVRDIPKSEKDKFDTLCTALGLTPQQAIRNFISAAKNIDDIGIIKYTAYALLCKDVNLIDSMINEREPLFKRITDESQRMAFRINFVQSNPSYIFQRYAAILQEGGTKNE